MARRCLAEPSDEGRRIELLYAATEILLALGEVAEAHRSADELAEFPGSSSIRRALAAHAQATVDVAAGDAAAALAHIRLALQTWVRLRAPYERDGPESYSQRHAVCWVTKSPPSSAPPCQDDRILRGLDRSPIASPLNNWP
jgi:hypothetical protein